MRVMTYNIRGGLGMDGRRNTARIADAVLEWSPDIVCFQEVHQRLPQSGWADQPRQLGRLLRMGFTFQSNLRIGWGNYGVGVASRYPVRSVRRHRLPSRGEPRGALEVVLDMPNGGVTVFCTHWGLDRKQRTAQAERLASLVAAAPRPVLVCGDLNDAPDVDYVQDFLQRTGLIDAGAAGQAPTYPSDAPMSRIDSAELNTDCANCPPWLVSPRQWITWACSCHCPSGLPTTAFSATA